MGNASPERAITRDVGLAGSAAETELVLSLANSPLGPEVPGSPRPKLLVSPSLSELPPSSDLAPM